MIPKCVNESLCLVWITSYITPSGKWYNFHFFQLDLLCLTSANLFHMVSKALQACWDSQLLMLCRKSPLPLKKISQIPPVSTTVSCSGDSGVLLVHGGSFMDRYAFKSVEVHAEIKTLTGDIQERWMSFHWQLPYWETGRPLSYWEMGKSYWAMDVTSKQFPCGHTRHIFCVFAFKRNRGRGLFAPYLPTLVCRDTGI